MSKKERIRSETGRSGDVSVHSMRNRKVWGMGADRVEEQRNSQIRGYYQGRGGSALQTKIGP